MYNVQGLSIHRAELEYGILKSTSIHHYFGSYSIPLYNYIMKRNQ